ncbi:hypothetical protein AJ80_07694 [Polytolypa hystricis UAMH7299]|uniref:UBA domain-containing protein n=1 Tax=Polytolypa hystricis (strain UAMH7299) TaxID=1447883 RepID=A0A2B7XKF5_POLH7|nr:hypothetical protein AJ80_07694 [Polytolypa hystricis UAMH7299]
MDDLTGLSWNSAPAAAATNAPPASSISSSAFSTLRPTPPLSGRSTPLLGTSGLKAPSKPSTPANDSFAGLVSFSSGTQGKNLSLLEQQKQLAAQKAQQEAERRAKLEAQYGGSNTQFWDSLEKGGTGQSRASGVSGNLNGPSAPVWHPPSTSQKSVEEDEEDILAAFNASAPVDASTHFPIPSSSSPPQRAPSTQLSKSNTQSQPTTLMFDDDDDTFGLSQLKSKPAPQTTVSQNTDDDDVLGLLAKPISQFAQPRQARTPTPPEPSRSASPPRPISAVDKAIAELVDMGFPIENAREALSATESGRDVQAAVGLLLSQAHAESQQKAKGRRSEPARDRHIDDRVEGPVDEARRGRRDPGVPTWMRDQERSSSARDRTSNRSPATREKDAAKLASEFGNNLFKSANSLWKTGTKKVHQAVQEFNAHPDSSQPRWMRETMTASETHSAEYRGRDSKAAQQPIQSSSASKQQAPDITDEALLLEIQRPESKRPQRPNHTQALDVRPESFRDPSPGASQRLPPRSASGFQQQQTKRAPQDPRGRLSRFDVESQASQAYISPARRRKPATPSPTPASEPDLLEGPKPAIRQTRTVGTSPLPQSRPSQSSTPLPVRPKAPPRSIPPVSGSTLTSSHQYRQKGSEAYKVGDYAAAHAAYCNALSGLPDKHPLTILLLSNRAFTFLKIGEPKSAIIDADTAIAIIGPSKGESEKIELGPGEPMKGMREIFGKVLMRKAEALEQLERWEDATKVWREAVESGHGGSTSIQGRNRCEKAAGISQPTAIPVSSSRPALAKRPIQAVAKVSRPTAVASAKSNDAVNRLRAANEAADRADNEKFALSDAVDARLTAWKGGKQDNLRALLASLDKVLWPEARWKKISMAELVLPNKVKIQYMKGIAKVHPDKISVNETTEHKMIAGAVFSTLNEAWDKFKAENGL